MRGVTLREGTAFTGLLREGGSARGVTATSGSREETFFGKFIIGADGVHSAVAKEVGLLNRRSRHRSFAVRAYFEGVEGLGHFSHMYFEKNLLPAYSWVFPTGRHSANVGLGVFNRYHASKGVKELFDAFLQRSTAAGRVLKNAMMVEGSLKGWPLFLGVYYTCPSPRGTGNVLLVGDAASFVDPFTGEGIYYALRSGELAAHAVAMGLSDPAMSLRTVPLYERMWRGEFKWKEFMPGYMLQPLLTRERLINFLIARSGSSQRRKETLGGAIGHAVPKWKLLLALL